MPLDRGAGSVCYDMVLWLSFEYFNRRLEGTTSSELEIMEIEHGTRARPLPRLIVKAQMMMAKSDDLSGWN
jgi:hypothetical protein